LHVMEMLRASGQPLSQLALEYDTWHRSGELNSPVSDAAACQDAVAEALRGRGAQNRVDGLTVENRDERWWVNLRASNTEPLLRLNVEARDAEQMVALRDEVLGVISDSRNNTSYQKDNVKENSR
ncbi:MAG: hypothetical protein ACTHU1_13940, partial [Arachnia sp.]